MQSSAFLHPDNAAFLNLSYSPPTYSTTGSIIKLGTLVDNASMMTTLIGFNNLNNASQIKRNIYAQPWYIQLMYCLIFGILVILSTLGNSCVLWIIYRNRIGMRTPTHFFIFNMSVADTLMAIFNIAFNFVYMMNSHWPWGLLYCRFSNVISSLTLCVSVFTLVAICVDRYFVLIQIIRHKLSRKKCFTLIGFIWISAFAISIPNLLYSHIHTWRYSDGTKRTVCYLEFKRDRDSLIYDLFLMVVTYFIPVTILAVVYFRIGRILWSAEIIGEHTEKQLSNLKCKRKVVKMMILVTSIFAICYLPYQTYFLLQKIYPRITQHAATQHVFLILYWFAMSNSMYNPFVYCWLNGRFRNGFKYAFRWCPFIHAEARPRTSSESFYSKNTINRTVSAEICKEAKDRSVSSPTNENGYIPNQSIGPNVKYGPRLTIPGTYNTSSHSKIVSNKGRAKKDEKTLVINFCSDKSSTPFLSDPGNNTLHQCKKYLVLSPKKSSIFNSFTANKPKTLKVTLKNNAHYKSLYLQTGLPENNLNNFLPSNTSKSI